MRVTRAARSVLFKVTLKLVLLVISTLGEVSVYGVEPPLRVRAPTTMSLVAPVLWLKPVPVTTSTPVRVSKVVEVMVGTATLLTVTPLPVRSATTTVASAPLAQSSAAARL